jgi:hypothetical protein
LCSHAEGAEVVSLGLGEPHHAAEVEHGHGLAAREEEVASVSVGVEHAVLQQDPEDEAPHRRAQPRALGLVEASRHVHRLASCEERGEHTPSRPIGHHAGHEDVGGPPR